MLMQKMTRDEYVIKLYRKGYEHIGAGVYSAVLSKPGSDTCIKVGRNDNWPMYIAWAAQRGYLGTFAPMVFAFKQYPNFYVAKMELLVETLSRIENQIYRCELLDMVNTARNMFNPWMSPEAKGKLPIGPWREFLSKLHLDNLLDDAHLGNWMVRKDGQIVLIDPTAREKQGNDPIRIKSGQLTSTARRDTSTKASEEPSRLNAKQEHGQWTARLFLEQERGQIPSAVGVMPLKEVIPQRNTNPPMEGNLRRFSPHFARWKAAMEWLNFPPQQIKDE